jgi:hypothetical protein
MPLDTGALQPHLTATGRDGTQKRMPNSLKESAEEFTRAAFAQLRTTYPPDDGYPQPGEFTWVRSPGSEHVYEIRQVQSEYWQRGLKLDVKRIRSLEKYLSFTQALRADSNICAQIGKTIACLYSFHLDPLTVDDIADRLLLKVAEAGGGFEFSKSAFEHAYARLDEGLRRNYYEVTAISPLLFLKANSAPFMIDKDSEIDELSEKEINLCLRVGVTPGIGRGGHVLISKPLALKFRFHVEKKIGFERTEETRKEFLKLDADINTRIENVVHALRILKNGRVLPVGRVLFSEQWPGTFVNGQGVGHDLMPRGAHEYELSESEAEGFATFWSSFERARTRKFIATAIRRFGYSCERRLAEDALADLVIAMESLFLGDVGEAKERGELRYRLAQRFAFFTANGSDSRRHFLAL